MTEKPVLLCIMDGWGWRQAAPDNATTCAQTPVFSNAWSTSPHALLQASEEYVGLPKGQIGNSEVGHMNLGAGRVVFQDLPLIDRTILRGEMPAIPQLQNFVAALKQSGGTCHLMGLASPGGVHAHQDHFVFLARHLESCGIPVLVHAFLDGRDVPPESAITQIAKLQKDLGSTQIATLCGRYFAMDRDTRWDRVQKAYELLVQAKGTQAQNAEQAIRDSYASKVSDEFVQPVCLNNYQGMKDGDGVLFANFRTDRAREILSALLDPAFDGFARTRPISFAAALGMVEYSEKLNLLMEALFPPKEITNSLGEVIAAAGQKQLRIAETEKYPHVTFFFNGGREEPYAGEERIMVPSPKVATYDLQPEMSAAEVTDKVVEAVLEKKFGLIVLNFANPDMVGHTGFLDAAMKAVETIDVCLGRLFDAATTSDTMVLLTADHGNCETMVDPITHGPHTAHTLEPVPVLLFNGPTTVKGLRNGKLADIAPTILALKNMAQPAEMDGESLLVV